MFQLERVRPIRLGPDALIIFYRGSHASGGLVFRHRGPVSTEGADAPLWVGATTSSRCAALPTVDTAVDRETAERSEAHSSAIARRSNAARVDAAAHECQRTSVTGH